MSFKMAVTMAASFGLALEAVVVVVEEEEVGLDLFGELIPLTACRGASIKAKRMP